MTIKYYKYIAMFVNGISYFLQTC